MRLTDVETLRRLAEILEVPPKDLGVTATVVQDLTAEDDPVRRRELLRNLAVTAAASAAQVRAGVAAAMRAFQACRYEQLAVVPCASGGGPSMMSRPPPVTSAGVRMVLMEVPARMRKVVRPARRWRI